MNKQEKTIFFSRDLAVLNGLHWHLVNEMAKMEVLFKDLLALEKDYGYAVNRQIEFNGYA